VVVVVELTAVLRQVVLVEQEVEAQVEMVVLEAQLEDQDLLILVVVLEEVLVNLEQQVEQAVQES
jgi:hypothetical protein